MTIMFNGTEFSGGGARLVFGGKAISKVMFNKQLVYSSFLAAGTILWSGSLHVEFGKTPSIKLSNLIKDDWSNIKNGLSITYSGAYNKTITESILKSELFGTVQIDQEGLYINVSTSKDDKKMTFSSMANTEIYSITVS